MNNLLLLNEEMRKLYGPQEALDEVSMREDPFAALPGMKVNYRLWVEEAISSIHAKLAEKYRWLAIVYRSASLQKFIFNHAHSLLAVNEAADFTALQSHVFDWYENRAQAGEIVSLFQIALSDKYYITRCPCFGFSRKAGATRPSWIYDISKLFPDEFIAHYHARLMAIIRGKEMGDCFAEIDHVVQCASSALLATTWGAEEATKLKYGLAEITQNPNIVRNTDKQLLAGIFCLVIVDPGWRFYYYRPYKHVGRSPYGAIGIACSSDCNVAHMDPSDCRYIFRPWDNVENFLSMQAVNASRSWKDNYDKNLAHARRDDAHNFRKNYSSALRELLMQGRGVALKLSVPGSKEPSASVPDNEKIVEWVYVPIGKLSASLSLGHTVDKFHPQEIEGLVSFLNDTIKEKALDPELTPFDAQWLELNGWLDVDVISSTRIFAELSAEYRMGDSYRLSEKLNDYFEEKIYGNGALKINETPDGWMCGFASIEAALRAACGLVKDLETQLNSSLRKNTYIAAAIRGGIGIRIGVHHERVVMRKDDPLAREQDDALNHTGHLQKQGGELFLRGIMPRDPDRPDAAQNKDKLAWVMALSSSAARAFSRLAEAGYEPAVWVAKHDKLGFKIDDLPCAIYGARKSIKDSFDEIDEVMSVGKILCDTKSRTYPYIKDEARAVLRVIEKSYEASVATPGTCLDIGSGSGIYTCALSKHYPHAQITSIEPDHGSCETWKRNVKALGVERQCRLIEKPFADAVSSIAKVWDLAVFNLPYVPTNEDDKTFSHSAGGPHGLKITVQVLDWLNRADVVVDRCVFPTYSLARDEDFIHTLLWDELQNRKCLMSRYDITWDAYITPNWFVLGYSDDADRKCVPLAQAYPEARRRIDVANWLHALSAQGLHYVWHGIVEMNIKR